jgi:hypothetical protein
MYVESLILIFLCLLTIYIYMYKNEEIASSAQKNQSPEEKKTIVSPRKSRRLMSSPRKSPLTPRVSVPPLMLKAFFPRPGFLKPPDDKGNNCLFQAVITSGVLRDPITNITANPQALRDICDQLLKEEGLPLFQIGTPAGEQYLPALSKILHRQIAVFKNKTFLSLISHEDVTADPDNKTLPILIEHQGQAENGHWVSASHLK